MTAKPPRVLDNANVLEYAIIGAEVQYTGKVITSMNFEIVEDVPCLAICRYDEGNDFYLFYCDSSWRVLAAGGGNSVEEVKALAEKAYKGISAQWREYV